MFITRYIKENPFINEIGVFLVHTVLGLFRLFKFSNREESDKIGIVALHRLGDSVFTIPAIKQIINHYKKNIFLICFPETMPIYKIGLKSIDYIELSHDDFIFNDRIAKNSIRKKIKELKFSIIFDLTGVVRSASLLFNNPAKEIIGLNEIYYSPIYTRYTRIRTEPHITDNYLDVVRMVFPLSNSLVIKNNQNYSGDYILLHPFAGVNSKEWGLKKYIHLAESLNEKVKCILVSQPDKISQDIKNELKKKNLTLVETGSTLELMEIIQNCFLFIGNDSGPVHIASLLGKPTFTIYGPTNPDFHKPLNGLNEYIIKEINCSPKHNKKMCLTLGGVYCPSYECMHSLSFAEVEKQLLKYIKKLTSSESHLIGSSS